VPLRDGKPLSLLMIDIDRFKKFNDQYGHPAGNACLRSVAGVLTAEAQRITDLAARYGGEEFAVLLPNTDAAGWIGERIRGALREAGIPHALNPPSGLVTASLGGAGARPAAERSAGLDPLRWLKEPAGRSMPRRTVGVIDWSFHVKSWRCFPSHRPGDDGRRNRKSSGSEIN
jgi:diguanylate cyclase (GGDEF)-like protein